MPSKTTFPSTISIIGSGRVGTALAIAFGRHGYVVEAVVGRTASSAIRAARVSSIAARTLATNQLDELPPSDLIIIATPDDQIESIAERLADASKVGKKRRVALHTSGAVSSETLHVLKPRNFAVGSFHPMVSISDSVLGARRLEHAYVGVEGQPEAMRVARKLAASLGAKSFSISVKDKALYHAAAVMSAGNVVSLVDIAIGMLVECGLSETLSRAVLIPLLESTIQNLSEQSPVDALTGPLVRSDSATVKAHIEALSASRIADAAQVYSTLGLHAVHMLEGARRPMPSNQELENILRAALSKI